MGKPTNKLQTLTKKQANTKTNKNKLIIKRTNYLATQKTHTKQHKTETSLKHSNKHTKKPANTQTYKHTHKHTARYIKQCCRSSRASDKKVARRLFVVLFESWVCE